jgi:hypothetical protein
MILERTKDEILIRLPANIDVSELQTMLDYLQYLELTANSSATETDVESLAESTNKSMWQKVKETRGL